MRTVLLTPRNLDDILIERWEVFSEEDDHIDYLTDDLQTFLSALTAG